MESWGRAQEFVGETKHALLLAISNLHQHQYYMPFKLTKSQYVSGGFGSSKFCQNRAMNIDDFGNCFVKIGHIVMELCTQKQHTKHIGIIFFQKMYCVCGIVYVFV